jgi:hypothetical protein
MEKELTNYNYDKSEIENMRNRIFDSIQQNSAANDAESD